MDKFCELESNQRGQWYETLPYYIAIYTVRRNPVHAARFIGSASHTYVQVVFKGTGIKARTRFPDLETGFFGLRAGEK